MGRRWADRVRWLAGLERRTLGVDRRVSVPVTLVATVGLLVGCAITVPCPDVVGQVVELPSGTFAPAVAYEDATRTGAPFFTTTFPRGAADTTLTIGMVLLDDRPSYDASAYPSAGQAIPSASLRIDRQARTVVRSYVNAAGEQVEERWRWEGGP